VIAGLLKGERNGKKREDGSLAVDAARAGDSTKKRDCAAQTSNCWEEKGRARLRLSFYEICRAEARDDP